MLTSVSTDDPAVMELFERTIFEAMEEDSFWLSNFGGDEESIVNTSEELMKSQGDKITFTLIYDLDGDPIMDGEVLHGNEESLDWATAQITLHEYVFGVITTKFDKKKPIFSIPKYAAIKLKRRGTKLIDTLLFDEAGNAPSKTFYGSTATAKSNLVDSSAYRLNTTILEKLKTWAMTGGGGSQPKIEPAIVDGEKVYAFVCHPDSLYDLEQDTTFSDALKYAMPRSSSHPFFKNMKYHWKGIAIFTNEHCEIGTNAGASSNVPYSIGYFLGAQAMLWGWGERPSLVPELFDYRRQLGWSWQMMAALGKARFDSKDFALIQVMVSRTNIAGM